jgi:hypothetical protein
MSTRHSFINYDVDYQHHISGVAKAGETIISNQLDAGTYLIPYFVK